MAYQKEGMLFSINKQIKQDFRNLAKQRAINMSQLVENMIREWIEKNQITESSTD